MVVRIRVPKRGMGDALVELAVEDAKAEIENAARNGYIATYDSNVIRAADLKDGMEITFTPTGTGG